MLDPHTRLLYLEALRPPDEYRLDWAIATTFSLDLLSLLMTPLSMVFAEQGDQESLLKDPIAFLEALQRTKDRIVVFCQAGQIAIPAVDTRLYSYLEPIVVEVQPQGKGVFHPKVWLQRFISNDRPVLYRLLCLSRNLTFDRSWDTVLALEGVLDEQRQRGFSLNRPLGDFLQVLPDLALTPISAVQRAHLERMADEVRRVRFEPPSGFDEIKAFIPAGIGGYKNLPTLADYHRLLVISPFLADTWLRTLADYGQNNILISRPDSLDAVSPALMDRMEANTTIYIMDEGAERPEETEYESEVDASQVTSSDLSGLHAKLYLIEQGWYATVLTGSANATTAGFNGKNVEFMVALTGKRSQVGIDRLLEQDGQTTSLASMLQRYRRPGTPPPSATVQKQLEYRLEDARRALAAAGLAAMVKPDEEGTFKLEVAVQSQAAIKDNAVRGRCAPISLHFSQAQDIASLTTGQTVTFSGLSLVGLTGFFAVELTARLEDQQATIGFVLNLPVEGMPSERDKHILHSVISDRSRFIRYLLFLLAEESEELSIQDLLVPGRAGANGAAGDGAGLPLLEELVRASCRQPEKIDRIADLIEDLQQTEAGRALLPEGFEQIWDAFRAVRQGESR